MGFNANGKHPVRRTQAQGRRCRLKYVLLCIIFCGIFLLFRVLSPQVESEEDPNLFQEVNATLNADVCAPVNLTVEYPCMPYTSQPFMNFCEKGYAAQRRREADVMQLRFFASYNRYLGHPCSTQAIKANEAAVPYAPLPGPSTNIKEVNTHFSCAALRSLLGWEPSDVLPQARQYFRRHARIVVNTGSMRSRHLKKDKPEPADGAADHMRVRLFTCLWMHALEGDGVVHLFTDDNRSVANMPPTTVPHYNMRNFTWHEMSDEQVALYNQEDRLVKHIHPPWMLAQYRFYDAVDFLHKEMQRQPELRWAILLDDDTNVQLNRLASLLHRRQLEYLYRSPTIPWREAAPATNKAWERVCASLTVADLQAAGAYESCATLPRAMANLHTTLRQHVGQSASLDELLMWLVDMPAMQKSETRAALWEQSQRLLPPWALARLLPALYINAQPFGGCGHYLMRGALQHLVPPLAVPAKRMEMLLIRYPSDEIIWRLLPRGGYEDRVDFRGGYTFKSDQQLLRFYQNTSSLVLSVRERDMWSWCCEMDRMNQSPGPQQTLWDGRSVTYHQKEDIREDAPQTLWTILLYYVALYKEETLRRQAMLVLKERIRSFSACTGC